MKRPFFMNTACCLLHFIVFVSILPSARAERLATVSKGWRDVWTLQNETLEVTLSVTRGSLAIDRLVNREAKVDYLVGRPASPLFSHVINGVPVSANDGGWTLTGATVSDIECFGKKWGKRLEISLTRSQPVAILTRQVFEIYNGLAALRASSWVKNQTEREVTIQASDVLSLNLPDNPHTLYAIEGVLNWQASTNGLSNGGRNALVRYDTGDGWFIIPENNWATCLEPGRAKAHSKDKLLGIFVWDGAKTVRVATNPKAVQLVLFPQEEVEYFAVNLGSFTGDVMDGRMAVAEHFRKRYTFHDTAHILSSNDWQWRDKRTDANYRNIVIPKAKAAGFDRIHIDDFWYEPSDGVDPKEKWTDMPALCDFILANGMKPGHWFSLQGKICTEGWGNGRDCADPANVDFKLKQMQETLLGKYHTAWDQVDAGLLWKTDQETAYSHPSDSVYRKILGMRRYMNTIARQHPDFIMQTTCEVDNPAGPGAGDSHGNQNVGLLHLADNGIAGMYRRTEYGDDVRDLFADVGMFPLEGMLSTWGEDGNAGAAWKDSPLWYYQFLLARHTSIYSWPGDWSPQSVAHLRVFNDWRNNPRFKAVLNELMRPVYNGPDWLKNEGPWCWMFTDERRTQALVFALNHLGLTKQNAFAAKLRWLDGGKTYLVQEITQTPFGDFTYVFRGEFAGTRLQTEGLPVDLEAGVERCAAFWIQEMTGNNPQVLYADSAVTRYSRSGHVQGTPNATARLIVYKPAQRGVEELDVKLDAQGQAAVTFDATTVTPAPRKTLTTDVGRRDTTTAGNWADKYGRTAAWLAGQKIEPAGAFTLTTAAPVYVWPRDDGTARVLVSPSGARAPACWTAPEHFTMTVNAPAGQAYRLAVFVMDYDNTLYPARAMEITVKSWDGKVHDRQTATVSETNHGIYFCWDVTGPVTITARKKEGFNAAVSGVFVDPVQKEKSRQP
jgi:hypothetical protein